MNEYRIVTNGVKFGIQYRRWMLWPTGFFASGTQETISGSEIWDDTLCLYDSREEAIEQAERFKKLNGPLRVV